jgi:hypothetical protein
MVMPDLVIPSLTQPSPAMDLAVPTDLAMACTGLTSIGDFNAAPFVVNIFNP